MPATNKMHDLAGVSIREAGEHLLCTCPVSRVLTKVTDGHISPLLQLLLGCRANPVHEGKILRDLISETQVIDIVMSQCMPALLHNTGSPIILDFFSIENRTK